MLGPSDKGVKPRPRTGFDWVVLGLGANLGDRDLALESARSALTAAGFVWTRATDVLETEPLGGPTGQPRYLNQLIGAPRDAVRNGSGACFDPAELLQVCHAIERAAGRDRACEVFWGPRTLDIDVILFGDLIVDQPGLTIPHPRLAERPFVIEPLLELWPDALGLAERTPWNSATPSGYDATR